MDLLITTSELFVRKSLANYTLVSLLSANYMSQKTAEGYVMFRTGSPASARVVYAILLFACENVRERKNHFSLDWFPPLRDNCSISKSMDFQLEQEKLLRNYSGSDLFLVRPGKIPGSGSSNNKYRRKRTLCITPRMLKNVFFICNI